MSSGGSIVSSLSPSELSQLGTSELKLQALANVLEAIFYGISIALYINSMRALIAPKRNSSRYSRKKQISLITFITYLIVSGTLAIGQTILSFMLTSVDTAAGSAIAIVSGTKSVFIEPIPLPLVIWGADGFMIWRCLVLYNSLSPMRRRILQTFLAVLALASFGTGILFFAVLRGNNFDGGLIMIPFSVFANVTLTSLIVGRILYHRRSLGNLMGSGHASMYTWIVSICIESCVLILVFETTCLVLIFTNDIGAEIIMSILPHIFVISALLLVYRVAEGREMNTTVAVSGSNTGPAIGSGASSSYGGVSVTVSRFEAAPHPTGSMSDDVESSAFSSSERTAHEKSITGKTSAGTLSSGL
ncbi:hypothetical protein D9613_003736 [Agrocybe pediades]|uniref:Uncharacterized protein n=1 Tax=Agrocybe pediades TaxID=84607 RepID=A0A8H4QK25_9AGAR|nr:hypothetical protein D9613_003736 [Agrocybe pediades]